MEECQSKISSSEFGEWIAYERISPTDPERQDLRFAVLCYHLVHLMGDTKGKDYKITDFMLNFDESRVALTDEEKRERSRNFWRAVKNG